MQLIKNMLDRFAPAQDDVTAQPASRTSIYENRRERRARERREKKDALRQRRQAEK